MYRALSPGCVFDRGANSSTIHYSLGSQLLSQNRHHSKNGKKLRCHLPFCFVRRRLLSFHFRQRRLLTTFCRHRRHLVILKRAKFSAPCACVDSNNADLLSDLHVHDRAEKRLRMSLIRAGKPGTYN